MTLDDAALVAPSDASVARPRIVLGVSGSIAAYKACEVVRQLTEAQCDVTVVATPTALKLSLIHI